MKKLKAIILSLIMLSLFIPYQIQAQEREPCFDTHCNDYEFQFISEFPYVIVIGTDCETNPAPCD